MRTEFTNAALEGQFCGMNSSIFNIPVTSILLFAEEDISNTSSDCWELE